MPKSAHQARRDRLSWSTTRWTTSRRPDGTDGGRCTSPINRNGKPTSRSSWPPPHWPADGTESIGGLRSDQGSAPGGDVESGVLRCHAVHRLFVPENVS